MATRWAAAEREGDEVGYGFGLREVEAAVGKGASGKFARAGSSTAAVYEGQYDLLGNVGRSVAGYLDRVLSGIGVRGTEERDNDLVEQVAFVAVYFAIGQGVGATLREGVTQPVGAEKSVDDVDGFGAADTNDGDASYPGRCGIRHILYLGAGWSRGYQKFQYRVSYCDSTYCSISSGSWGKKSMRARVSTLSMVTA